MEKYNAKYLAKAISVKEQKWSKHTIPLVCTSTVAYNQELYIRDCIEGILMQRTTFPVLVLIHDDASTDNTANIIKEYQKKFPNIIKAYFQTENTYGKPDRKEKLAEFFSWRVGKYIAYCEGDDYWTDPCKLQKQVEFLEAHPEYSLSYHDSIVVDENKNIINNHCLPRGYRRSYSQRECYLQIPIPTHSIVTKAELLSQLSGNVSGGDTLFLAIICQDGKVKNIDGKMGAYRKHSGGVYSLIPKVNKLLQGISERKKALPYLKKKFRSISEMRIFAAYILLSIKEKNKESRKKYLKESVKYFNFNIFVPLFLLKYFYFYLTDFIIEKKESK